MATVTFLVLEGVDKGRVFRDLPIPVTIGREEGNVLRLNDERVSRFHVKIQMEEGDVILTDLDSTNGTRVNGATVQIRRLRAGDQLSVGRSILLFGTMEEIETRRGSQRGNGHDHGIQTIRTEEMIQAGARIAAPIRKAEPIAPPEWSAREDDIPPMPHKLSGAQSARLAEIFDYMHRGLTNAVENIDANDDGTEVRLGFREWQTVQAVQMLLARYGRLIAEPEPSR